MWIVCGISGIPVAAGKPGIGVGGSDKIKTKIKGGLLEVGSRGALFKTLVSQCEQGLSVFGPG